LSPGAGREFLYHSHELRSRIAFLPSEDAEKDNAEVTSFEQMLMRAMGIDDPERLDELLAAPISEDAAIHDCSPDEHFDLAEAMFAEQDRQRDAAELFNSVAPGRYVN
jgi:hypothetical protein